ncbi:MAG: hypothetical protein A3E36_01085 [Candidatus Andersenbacteria bacterium RIFCSPHIGHO2_12_FULL_45_11b]|uniref:Uncharacterized protein n=1 Tax=Candidatus Andersenbacteria bacterium RIFCSPHIGHO2_12_FULL_45_11b TaxID=1797282 RepID=A0A1G1XBG7_9BACT|nr:MAG: hypothetical protein A3E36_01085 [Candidatus Andersenbacteria bacterium RIFCSPHIGHO2_12_FULL_45_11b]
MIAGSGFIVASNLLYVCIVLVCTYRMMRAASVYNWNPGKSDIQQAQKITILTSIIIIASVGLVAAITNILFG